MTEREREREREREKERERERERKGEKKGLERLWSDVEGAVNLVYNGRSSWLGHD